MKQLIFITGVNRIDKKLNRLPTKLQKKVIRQAIRDGLKLVKAETVMQAPRDTGLTAKSVKVRALKGRQRGRIAMEVSISGKVPGLIKTSESGERVFYPAVVEYGAKDHPPNPFMRRSFVAAGPTARELTMQKILNGVNREAAS